MVGPSPISHSQSKDTDEVAFAMSVFKALWHNVSYVSFAKLWESATAQDRVFLKHVLPRVRLRTYTILTKAYYTYPEWLLRRWLCFGTKQELETFLEERFGSKKEVEERIVMSPQEAQREQNDDENLRYTVQLRQPRKAATKANVK
ncbi:hypothetical protein HK102_013538 [Quaeritorhiza haematococci]|nr:hypothetical protein HK102_013538 [Quaeritorhiza haematococci]